MAGDGAIVGEVDLAHEDVRSETSSSDDAPLEVEEHVGGAAFRKGEAVERDMRCGGDLRCNARLRIRHGVVAGRRLLRGLRELVVVGTHGGAGERLHEQVAEVAASRAADGGLVEAVEFRVLELVAARVGPLAGTGRGAGLDETERRRRVGVAVRGALRADERIDVAREVLAG